MKSKIFNNIVGIKIKNLNVSDLDKIKPEKSLSEISKEKNKDTLTKSLSTFTKYFDNDDTVYHKIGQFYFFKIRNEKKDLPSSVVNEEMRIKQKEIEKNRGEKLKGKELRALKDDITALLLPKAFIKTSYLEFILNARDNTLFVNASSLSKADEVITMLRNYIDIETELLNPDIDMITKLTEWVSKNEAPEPFEIEDFVSMSDQSTGGITEYKKHDLHDYSKEIQANIESGKIVNSLRVNWHERISLTLNDKLILKQIKTMDTFEEGIEEQVGESDDAYDYFNATMTIFVEDICEIFEDISKIK